MKRVSIRSDRVGWQKNLCVSARVYHPEAKKNYPWSETLPHTPGGDDTKMVAGMLRRLADWLEEQ